MTATATRPTTTATFKGLTQNARGDDIVTIELGAHEYEVHLQPRPYNDSTRRTSGAPTVKLFLSGVDEDVPAPPYGARGENPGNDARWDAYNKLARTPSTSPRRGSAARPGARAPAPPGSPSPGTCRSRA
jgi:hypothetical protein